MASTRLRSPAASWVISCAAWVSSQSPGALSWGSSSASRDLSAGRSKMLLQLLNTAEEVLRTRTQLG